MTLFRQNLLSLVPLFFILGVLYALISYHLQTKELKWAIDQEAMAIGHTIQSFAEHNADRYFDTIDGFMDVTPEFELILNRIIRQFRNQSITVKNTEGDVLHELTTSDKQIDLTPWENPEILYESSFEGTHYYLARHDWKARMYVDVDIQTDDGIYSISIIRDGREYIARIITLRQWIGVEVLISILIGIVVSIVLTLFVRNRIKKLKTLSESFLGGNANLKLDQGSITEFNDLGSTLNILVHVFHKNMDWYRKSIQQKEQDRTSHNLAEFIKSETKKALSLNAGKVQIWAEYVGNELHPLFMGQATVGSTKMLIWGSVNQEDPVEAALLSEGIKQYLDRATADADIISSLRSVFGSRLHELQFLELTESGTVTHVTLNNSEVVSKRDLKLDPGSIHWIHGLNDSVSEKIEMYCQNATELPSDQLFSDITKIVGWLGSTILISVQYEA
ncbi:MAG: hypothetical protein LAT57_07620 [Balneolales bacterium]|nr:hypothetical protein [Balneolales bacterium]